MTSKAKKCVTMTHNARPAASHVVALDIPTRSTTSRRLIALDIDGTLLGHDGKVPTGTVDALDLVRAAGHEVVLATGRSLVGLLPVATQLGLVEGLAVCSNGTMTVRLDPSLPSGYVIDDARRFEPGPVIRRAIGLMPGVRVGVEEVGRGWCVNALFQPGLLNGNQKQVPLTDLYAAPATRVALHASGISRHLDALRAIGVTATPAGADWFDLTAAGTSKATALEHLRQHLGIHRDATVAVGDGANDSDLLAWAARGVAMGQASDALKAVADEVTGTIDEHGAVPVLRSLLPNDIDTGILSPLAAQLVTAVRTAPGPVVLRAWHDHGQEIARCDTWTLKDGVWVRHGPIPSGTGATMRGIELAAREAGLTYPRGQIGRRRAHWHSTRDSEGRAGFELPLHDEVAAPRRPAAPEPSMR